MNMLSDKGFSGFQSFYDDNTVREERPNTKIPELEAIRPG
jgi:hypothetical protein